MEDKTIGLIYAIKQYSKYAVDMRIRMFMSEWSESDWDWEGRDIIDDLLREIITDYLVNCNNWNEVRRYFSDIGFLNRSEYQRMISFLINIQVKKDDKYINGFKDNPYSHFKIFNIEEN